MMHEQEGRSANRVWSFIGMNTQELIALLDRLLAEPREAEWLG